MKNIAEQQERSQKKFRKQLNVVNCPLTIDRVKLRLLYFTKIGMITDL